MSKTEKHLSSKIIYLKKSATVINWMFTNIEFTIHRKINSRLFVMISHASLPKAKENGKEMQKSSLSLDLIQRVTVQ